MHDKLRDRLLGAWAGLVCDHPWWVLIAALALAGGGTWLTVARLGFQPDRNALISADLDWNARYIDYRQRFSYDGLTVVIAVPQRDGGRADAEAFADTLGKKLSQAEHVARVDWRIDADGPSAAIRLLDAEAFTRQVNRLAGARPLLAAPNLPRLLTSSLGGGEAMTDGSSAAEWIAMVRQLIDIVGAATDGVDGAALRARFAELLSSTTYLANDDGSLLFVQVEPKLAGDELEPVAPAVAQVRQLLAEALGKASGIEAGVTGVPVIEADETVVTQRDATIASVLAVGLIAVMLVMAFHSFHLPGLAVVSLLVGVAWSFGYLTLAIGHLQLLSVVFTVFLLGLGIDYGIHLISRFELVRSKYPPGPPGFREAMTDSIRWTGPGIATGAFTTAVAFGATLLTDFKGMAEMGHIAGVGIVLCLVAMVSVLPALMRLLRPRRRHLVPMEDRGLSFYEHHWWDPFYKRPALTVLIALAVTIAAGLAARDIRYDYNLSNLLPEDIESVQWFNRIAEGAEQGGAGGSSVWFGASLIDPTDTEAVAERISKFRRLETVSGVGALGMLCPADDAAKREQLGNARAAIGSLLDGGVVLPNERPQPTEWRATLGALRVGVGLALRRDEVKQSPTIREQLGKLRDRIDVAIAAIESHGDAAGPRLNLLHDAFIEWRSGLRAALDDATADRDLALDDLPELLRRLAVTDDGQLGMIQVFPAGNVYDPDELGPFIEQLRGVDPNVTGTAVQVYQSSRLMVSSYIKAGLIALAAVFLIVLMDFQRLFDALLCLVPVGMAFIILLGVLAANGMAINPANILVLPLLFGIGVDHGVHIVHRYRVAPEEHPPGLAAGTGKGIMLTSLTSMIGFASLMIAEHRGIRSLGFTLALGMALTMVICLTVMPAILEVRSRKYGVNGSHAWQPDADA